MVENQDISTGIVLGTPKVNGDGTGFVLRQPSAFVEPFPSERTLYWKPAQAAGGLAAPAVTVVITQEVLLAVNEHVSQKPEPGRAGARAQPDEQDGFVELGGFLLGNRYRCPSTHQDYIIIDCSSKARFTESTESDLSFTPNTWAHFADEFDLKFKGKLLVGWYHSHPNAGVFLSGMDVQIHTERFADFWTTALVIDPVKQIGGFFCWKEGKLETRQAGPFYEYLDHGSRESAVEWLNYKCTDPKTGKELKPLSLSLDRARRRANTARMSAAHGSAVAANSGRMAEGRWRSKFPYLLGAAALMIVLLFALVPPVRRTLFGLFNGDNNSSSADAVTVTSPTTPTPEFREEPNSLASLQLEVNNVVRLKEANKLEVDVNLKPFSDNLVVTIDEQRAVLTPAPKERSYKLVATAEVPETVDSLKKLPSEHLVRIAVLDRDSPESRGPTTTIPLMKSEIEKLFKIGSVRVKPQPVIPPSPTVKVPTAPPSPRVAVAEPVVVQTPAQQDAPAQEEQKAQGAPEGQQNPPEVATKEVTPKALATAPPEPTRTPETSRRPAEPRTRETRPQPERREAEVSQPPRPVIAPAPPEDEEAMKHRQKQEEKALKARYENEKQRLETQFEAEKNRLKQRNDEVGVERLKINHNQQKKTLKINHTAAEKTMKLNHQEQRKRIKKN
jgi:proteasome lid subunit RPN8/RPN11